MQSANVLSTAMYAIHKHSKINIGGKRLNTVDWTKWDFINDIYSHLTWWFSLLFFFPSILKVKDTLTFFHFPERCRIRQTFYNIMPCEGVPWSSSYWLSDRLEWKIWHMVKNKWNQFLYEYFKIQCLTICIHIFLFFFIIKITRFLDNLLSIFSLFQFLLNR